jgi:hypothetical protein
MYLYDQGTLWESMLVLIEEDGFRKFWTDVEIVNQLLKK